MENNLSHENQVFTDNEGRTIPLHDHTLSLFSCIKKSMNQIQDYEQQNTQLLGLTIIQLKPLGMNFHLSGKSSEWFWPLTKEQLT